MREHDTSSRKNRLLYTLGVRHYIEHWFTGKTRRNGSQRQNGLSDQSTSHQPTPVPLPCPSRVTSKSWAFCSTCCRDRGQPLFAWANSRDSPVCGVMSHESKMGTDHQTSWQKTPEMSDLRHERPMSLVRVCETEEEAGRKMTKAWWWTKAVSFFTSTST